jgi:hypothetical protein
VARAAFSRRAGPNAEYRLLDGFRIFLIGLSTSAVTPARAGDFIKAQLVKPYGIGGNVGSGVVLVNTLDNNTKLNYIRIANVDVHGFRWAGVESGDLCLTHVEARVERCVHARVDWGGRIVCTAVGERSDDHEADEKVKPSQWVRVPRGYGEVEPLGVFRVLARQK